MYHDCVPSVTDRTYVPCVYDSFYTVELSDAFVASLLSESSREMHTDMYCDMFVFHLLQIIQERLSNDAFVSSLLPESAPLSTMRVITGSRWWLDKVCVYVCSMCMHLGLYIYLYV